MVIPPVRWRVARRAGGVAEGPKKTTSSPPDPHALAARSPVTPLGVGPTAGFVSSGASPRGTDGGTKGAGAQPRQAAVKGRRCGRDPGGGGPRAARVRVEGGG